MSSDDSTFFGLSTKIKRAQEQYPLNQRGTAFFKYLLGTWLTFFGVSVLADLPNHFLFGGMLLAVPAVYVYVSRNYPAELSDAKLEELKDDDDVLSIGRKGDEDRPEVDLQEIGDLETESKDAKDIAKSYARMKMRLQTYEPEDLKSKDEVIKEIYEELAELGFHATHEQIKNWTQDLREDIEDDTE